jgi:hypothetical protein
MQYISSDADNQTRAWDPSYRRTLETYDKETQVRTAFMSVDNVNSIRKALPSSSSGAIIEKMERLFQTYIYGLLAQPRESIIAFLNKEVINIMHQESRLQGSTPLDIRNISIASLFVRPMRPSSRF